MFAGGWGIVLGAVVTVTSTTQHQFIGGRFLLGFGIALATIGAPVYILECAPPQWRGRLTALYNTGYFGGTY